MIIDADRLKEVIKGSIEMLCRHFFPLGKKVRSEWKMADTTGAAGDSLGIELTGDKAGLWIDRATGQSGDFVALLMEHFGVDFVMASEQIGSALGVDVHSHDFKPMFKQGEWTRCVARVDSAKIKQLCDWRGLSPKYVQWLIGHKLLGIYNECWAFPVMPNGSVVAIHYRLEPPAGKVKADWKYEPPKGTKTTLFVIGELAKAEYVSAFESQWDQFALDDMLAFHQKESTATVSTRGSSNAKLLAGLPENVKGVKLWPQNDEPGQKWLKDAIGALSGRLIKIARTPPSFKDVNDWIKNGATRADIEKINLEAETVTAPSQEPSLTTPPEDEADTKEDERFAALAAATLKGSDFLAIDIAPRQIIINDWLKEGDLGFVFAYRGTGKTWFSLALGSALAEGLMCGPWSIHKGVQWPVLYIDGEMPSDDIRERAKAINGGVIPDNFYTLNHEILFDKAGLVLNLATPLDQRLVGKLCTEKGAKVLMLDNLGCLFTGVGENDADEWEKVLPWLLELRRMKITVIIIHHTGVNPSRMRGTSKREDAAAFVLRLDDKKETTEEPGAKFITRFSKYRGSEVIPDYEWTIRPLGNVIGLSHKLASRTDVMLQLISQGVDNTKDIAAAMGLPNWTVSKFAKQLQDTGKIIKEKNGCFALVQKT